MAAFKLSTPAGVSDYAETPALIVDPEDLPKPPKDVKHPIDPLPKCDQTKVWEDLDKYEPSLRLNKIVYGWVSERYCLKKYASKYVVIYDRLNPKTTALCAFRICKHDDLKLNVPVPLSAITLCKPPVKRADNKEGFDLLVAARNNSTIQNVLNSKLGVQMDPHIRATQKRTQILPVQKTPEESAAAAASLYEGYAKYKSHFGSGQEELMEKQYHDMVRKMNDEPSASEVVKTVNRRIAEMKLRQERMVVKKAPKEVEAENQEEEEEEKYNSPEIDTYAVLEEKLKPIFKWEPSSLSSSHDVELEIVAMVSVPVQPKVDQLLEDVEKTKDTTPSEMRVPLKMCVVYCGFLTRTLNLTPFIELRGKKFRPEQYMLRNSFVHATCPLLCMKNGTRELYIVHNVSNGEYEEISRNPAKKVMEMQAVEVLMRKCLEEQKIDYTVSTLMIVCSDSCVAKRIKAGTDLVKTVESMMNVESAPHGKTQGMQSMSIRSNSGYLALTH